MKITPTRIPDVLVLEPKFYGDDRGFFFESYNQQRFNEAVGRDICFVQDNESMSKQAVLRGLHYQVVKPQGKLVRVSEGEVFDVAVDIRSNSPTFGQWVGETLSAKNKKQLWVPEGFAHGFLVLSEVARFHYKVTDYWYPEHERCIRFDDPDINIHWPVVPCGFPIALDPMLSDKDKQGLDFKNAEKY
ncbi:dTDP-4-dehydrorhamnose 3,5-epimerase [Dechloromonas agitata]|uniref:dTDP-4-dehydrorhamnose 3,5-epimerase n=1 Tax=Dechloromonas agitata TaxID=73030 RepID=UPI000A06682F|nr:dTDP-4-dehydrorhamnose 3,5-epimerase [Dechloromonas agitata]